MFFATKETVPEGVGFRTFDITHLTWLLFITAAIVITMLIYKKASVHKRNIMRITVGCIVVGIEIIKDIIAIVLGYFEAGHLPLHLCGINVLLILFDLIKPTKTVRHFLYYFSIPGALLALVFPNWTVLPCMNLSNIQSFLIHAFLVLYPIMLIADGEVTAKFSAMLKGVALLIGMAIPIYFINLALDTNFMFLMEPETGNPLGLFEKYLGSHLWGFPVLLPLVMGLMYLPVFIINKVKASKNTLQQKEYAVSTKQ